MSGHLRVEKTRLSQSHRERGTQANFMPGPVRWEAAPGQGAPLPSASPGSPTLSRVRTARASPAVDEQLFRSVEGQAASDEEKEEEGEKRPPAEVKKLLAGLSSCGSRYVSRGLAHTAGPKAWNFIRRQSWNLGG